MHDFFNIHHFDYIFADTDELGQMDSNHYEHNARQTTQQRNGNQQQKSINTLNMINSVLQRKTALNKLSR